MTKITPLRGSTTIYSTGLAAAVVVVLAGPLSAGEPPPHPWLPAFPSPPRGPFFGAPALPSPIPLPFVPQYPRLPQSAIPPLPSQANPDVSTDRCLITPSEVDPLSIKEAASIDPGIFKEPRVVGLPIRTPGRWRR